MHRTKLSSFLRTFIMVFAQAIRVAVTVVMASPISMTGQRCEAQRPAIQNVFHTAWSSENGVSAVFEVQQDADGYLWLTTANGIFRFDGVSFQSVEAATNNAVHNHDTVSVYVAPSGRIWFTARTIG